MNRTGIMVVYNDIVRDNRVLKMAHAMRRVFSDFTLIGAYKAYDPNAEPEEIKINGLNCVLFPNKFKAFEISDEELSEEEAFAERQRMAVSDLTKQIAEFIQVKRPSCVHTHDMYTIELGALVKRQAQSTDQDFFWIHDVHENARGATHMPPLLQKYAIELENENIEQADTVLTVTNELAQRLQVIHPHIKHLQVIYNSPEFLNKDRSFPRSLRDELDLGGEPIAVYLGQVKPLRGVERMVTALTLLPELHFAIITANKGVFINSIKNLAMWLGVSDRVHFVDYVPPGNVVDYIRSANMGVNPLENYGNAEVALPSNLFDYIFAGLPVLSHKLEAPENFFDEFRVGETVDFDHFPDVANATKRLLYPENTTHENLRQTIAEKYSWEIQESQLCKLYLGIIGYENIIVANPVKPLKLPPSDLKILHGITGAAGQPHVLAKALDKHKGITARSMQVTLTKFKYPTDIFYPVSSTSTGPMSRALSSVADAFDIFHIHSRGFLFDRLTSSYMTGMDLLALRAAGKKVIMHFRGSEARLASEFRKKSPYNYVDDDEERTVSKFPERAQRAYIETAGRICNRVLVNDPEIQSYVPGSIIVERALKKDDWSFVGLKKNSVPLIVHAPSRRGVKGTSHILEAVKQLKKSGLKFDFKLVENMPHEQAKALYEDADVIVDQLRIGWYGVLSVEAMALGKPVIAYIREDLEHHLGPYPPLMVSTPDTISADLRRLIMHEDLREEFSRRGREYFERVHADEVVAAKLQRIYAEVEQENAISDLQGLIRYLGYRGESELALVDGVKKERDKFQEAYQIAAAGRETRVQFVKRKYRQDGFVLATKYFAKRLVGIR